MSSETSQQIPGNSVTSEQTNEIVEQSVDNNTSWVSRHSRTLRDIGKVTVSVIIGVSIGILFSKKFSKKE